MKTVSLKTTKKEREEYMDAPMAVGSYNGPEYPYGTSIELRNETLEAMGIDLSDVEIDQEFTITGKCCVTRMSSSEAREGEPRKEMSLQITDLGLSKPGVSMEDSVKKILNKRFKGE